MKSQSADRPSAPAHTRIPRRTPARTLRSLLTVAAVLGLLLAGGGAPALVAAPAATGVFPAPVFDPTSVGWLSVRNMTSAQYATYFAEKSNAGYMVTDIEVDIVNGAYRVGAVWQKNLDGRGWYQLRDLTSDQFHDKWTEYKDAGYRLIDQESYVYNDTRFYAGVWTRNLENYGWASQRNLTSQQFSDSFTTYSEAGMMMIDVDAYPVGDGSELAYSAVWVENVDDVAWIELRDMTSAQFAAKFDEYKAAYRMIDIESYLHDGVQYYAGIWMANPSGRGWYEFRDMSSTEFGNKWLELRDAGYRLIDYNLYETENGWKYAGIWRMNGNRAWWPLKDEVDAAAQTMFDTFDIPGMSVAIAHKEQFVYLRGFGYADIDDGKIAHAQTVYPLASVSKAVAGVLGLELEEKNLLDLDALTSSYVGGLPAHHLLHTVRQTLNNRSGIGHYDSYSGQGFAPPYNSAFDAIQDVNHVPLAYATGTYTYSTFAYDWFGAAVEVRTAYNIRDALQVHLTAPYALGTLRAMHGAPADANRATGYNGSNQEIAPHETSHKVMGGGLEASAYDVARMGIKLMDGQILSAASLADMWTPPDGQSSYALGWNVGTEAGRQVVAKDGAQSGARAYIRMYPEEEIVIVVLTNRKTGGHSPSALAKQIGALMLAELDAAPAQASSGQVDAAAMAQLAPDGMPRPQAGDALEPAAEASDPALVVLPVVTNPAPPDPGPDEEEDADVVLNQWALYLPLAKR